MDRDKLVAAMQQEIKEIIALQTMLKNLEKAEQRGYETAEANRLHAISTMFAASNESLIGAYFKEKDETKRDQLS